MHTIEFKTKIKGGTITIPENLKDEFEGLENVKVILVKADEKNGSGQKDMIQELLDHPLEIENFAPLSREELYDR